VVASPHHEFVSAHDGTRQDFSRSTLSISVFARVYSFGDAFGREQITAVRIWRSYCGPAYLTPIGEACCGREGGRVDLVYGIERVHCDLVGGEVRVRFRLNG